MGVRSSSFPPKKVLAAEALLVATGKLHSRIGLAMWLARRGVLRLTGRSTPEAARLLYLDPAIIRRGLWRLDVLRSFRLSRQRDLVGLVGNGDWDLEDYPLEELGIFAAIRHHFEEGTPWEDLPYFEEMRKAIETGRPRFKYRNYADIPRQWKRIDKLHALIRTQGYRTQADQGTRRPWDEIVVALNRHGDFVFLDGRHRLAIVKALGLARLPVLVGVRHATWAALREDVRRRLTDSEILTPSHPDLPQAISPRQRDGTVEGLLASIPHSCQALDLEPGDGYWCQKLSMAEYECLALGELASPQFRPLMRACHLSVPFYSPDDSTHQPRVAFALGGCRPRLWDLPNDRLDHLLSQLILTHLGIRVPASEPAASKASHLVLRLQRVLDLPRKMDVGNPQCGERNVVLYRGDDIDATPRN